MVVVPHKLQVAKHGARALRLLLVKAEMLQATLVVVAEAAGMAVVHVLIIVTALTTEAIMAEVQDMFTLQLLLLIIQVVIM